MSRDLAANGLTGDAGGQVHGGAKEVAVELDVSAVMQTDADRRALHEFVGKPEREETASAGSEMRSISASPIDLTCVPPNPAARLFPPQR